MSNWTSSVLTAAGRRLHAKAEAGIATLTLSKIKIGDGTENIANVDSLTDLKSARYSIGISSIEKNGEVCTVKGVLSSSTVTTEFYARELGLFATDPDDGEILYAIAIDNNPDPMQPNTSSVISSAEYAISIVASSSMNLSISLDSAGLITQSILNAVIEKLNAGSTTQPIWLDKGTAKETDAVTLKTDIAGKGSAIQPAYIDSDGKAQACSFYIDSSGKFTFPNGNQFWIG